MPRIKGTQRVNIDCNDENCKVQQHYKEECNINNIVRKIAKGFVPPMVAQRPFYADVSGVEDYQTSLTKVVKAQQQFDMLPANIRAKFFNRPENLIEWLQDENNRSEAEKLGLVEKQPKNRLNEGVEPKEKAPATAEKEEAK